MAGETDRTRSQWLINKREAIAEHGMVTAMHPLAAEVGLEMLRRGGNAVDAAVATAFAIGVVEPFMSGVGGVTAMVIHIASTRQTIVIDGSSRAPARASADMFELAPSGSAAGMYGWRGTVGDAQNMGYRAPIVPGQPACLLYALERYGSGRLSRAEVMQPAIRLAENGFPVDPYVAGTTAFAMRRLRAFPETMRTFFVDGEVPLAPGTLSRPPDRLIQPDLARTLRSLADAGPGVLYEGDLGAQLVADLQANGGIITRDDLAAYRVRELAPLRLDYRGWELLGLSATSGSMTAFEALAILESFDLRTLGAESVDALHLVTEALRRAFVDRFAYLADTDCQTVPTATLLSKPYAASRAGAISVDRAAPDAQPGKAWSFAAGGAQRTALTDSGVTGGDGCTTHLNVVDADRNMVACTSTLGEVFGSAVVARGTGILLNNGMTWFDPEPGHVNSIQPGKRTLWAPSPTLVLRDGSPYLAIGAPGGRRIISAVVQSLVNVLDHQMGVQAAVSRPRVHCEGQITEIDTHIDPDIVAELERRGHRVAVQDEMDTSSRFARPGGIRIDPHTHELTAGVHQYTPAWAMGY